ncbi:MAG: hypothetical protein OEM51_05435 [Gammaproteobacteria bacterium]|nr:hypothetical protein [Gammaproteobacteria bacterium]
MHNEDINKQDQEIQALLKDYPMPAADAGFYDQALIRATHEGSRRQRNKWLLTGFGAAIAATIAVWMIGGILLTGPQLPDAGSTIPGVTVALEEPRTVNLVFASATALDSATLTVTLPDGIELNGFPGQREITWETSLNEGRNLLPLTLIALTPTGGELLARLEHKDRDRTFRLRVDVT